MDGAILAAFIAGTAAVLGPPLTAIITWRLGRRRELASAELNEVQAEAIRAETWQQVHDTLRMEIIRIQGRLTEVESKYAELSARDRMRSAELAAVMAERDSLRVRLAVAESESTSKERTIGDLRTALATLHNPPAPP